MSLLKHELRQGRTAFLIWTGAIAVLLVLCIFLFPEMKEEMGEIGQMFSNMGAFSAAFGMDRLNFGTFIGYYAIECGNVLGLGGAFFAALCAVDSLSKEERTGTAEFLLTHPVSRRQVVREKLLSVFLRITALNLICYALVLISALLIKESIPWKEINLLHLAYFIMQLEIGAICFGLSAFLRKGAAGAGLGVAVLAYMLNIIANLTKSVEFLKNITPFGYCDGAEIVSQGRLFPGRMGIGLLISLLCLAAAYWQYGRKDIR